MPAEARPRLRPRRGRKRPHRRRPVRRMGLRTYPQTACRPRLPWRATAHPRPRRLHSGCDHWARAMAQWPSAHCRRRPSRRRSGRPATARGRRRSRLRRRTAGCRRRPLLARPCPMTRRRRRRPAQRPAVATSAAAGGRRQRRRSRLRGSAEALTRSEAEIGGLCGQVFGPQSPDPAPEECQIGDIERERQMSARIKARIIDRGWTYDHVLSACDHCKRSRELGARRASYALVAQQSARRIRERFSRAEGQQLRPCERRFSAAS